MKTLLFLLASLSLLLSMTCYSNTPSLQRLCEKVAPQVESLWGKVKASVTVVKGSVYETKGTPYGNTFTIIMKDNNLCAMAHELTHVIELSKGYLGEDWFNEGLADLSCYLLYPDYYPKEYIVWIEKGYGEYDSYFFGLTVLYYAYAKGMNVLNLRKLDYIEASRIFAKALEEGLTPFGVKPHPPLFGKVRINGKGWAYTKNSEGGLVLGDVTIFTHGGVARFPWPALLPLFVVSRRGRRSK